MQSADIALLKATWGAIEAALGSSMLDARLAQKNPTDDYQGNLIVFSDETEVETRPHKEASHSGNTMTLRIYGGDKMEAKRLTALCIGATTATKLDLSGDDFRLKDNLEVDMNESSNTTTDTGTDFSQVLRLRGDCQPIS